MASKRNRIINIIKYLETLNITVNIGKNKAQGNKGFFKAVGKNYRIDISKEITDDAILSTLAHEFAHYLHFMHDKTLKSLDFIFTNTTDEIMEELISATIDLIPKTNIAPLFELKEKTKNEIKEFELYLKDNKIDSNKIEAQIKKTKYKHFLKYDRVKYIEGFSTKIYGIEDLELDKNCLLYIKLKSKQRELRRINSRITKLNKYYNLPTELFARSFEYYIKDKNKFSKKAPNVFNEYEKLKSSQKIPCFSEFINIIEKENLNN